VATGNVMSVTAADVQPESADEWPAPFGVGQPSLLEWQARLLASTGFRAISLQNRVERMGTYFRGNVAQYKSLVARLQDPAVSLPIMDVRNPDAHDDLLSEAERLLHNVLTAMSTRVDQQRCFMEKYCQDDSVLMKEYGERIASTFVVSLEAAFLKGLRNYITHTQLPVAQSRQILGRETFSVTFILPGTPLLTWGGWNSTVRAWIVGQGEAVTIVDVIDVYARLAGGFDKWLFNRIGLKYATEIAAFLREQEEYTREVDRVFGA
jgi:hypothetical protein